MIFVIVVLSFPLIISGYKLMNRSTYLLGTELLTDKLAHQIMPVESSYERLKMIGLEDSTIHLDEIRQRALVSFARFRYLETGRIFVIGRDRSILLSNDFANAKEPGFANLFAGMADGRESVNYRAQGHNKLAIFTLFERWDCYVGISIDHAELFAARNKFLLINALVLAGTILLAVLLMIFLQRLIISPLIRLADFTTGVMQEVYKADVPGQFLFELGTLKTGLCSMVADLVNKMGEAENQLEVISEREAELDIAHKALLHSEAQLQAILDNSTAVVYLKDIEGCYLSINRQYEEVFHIRQEEILGRNDHDIFPKDVADALRENDRRIFAGKMPQVLEEQIPHDDGLLHTYVSVKFPMFDENGDIYAVGGISTDITSRKEAEEKLAAEQERLAVTLRSIGDGVITTDIDGRVMLVNKVAEELTGWKQSEALGRSLEEVLNIVDMRTGDKIGALVPRIIGAGQVSNFSGNLCLIAKDGTRREIADSGAPIHDRKSRTIGVVLVFRDITEKVRTDLELLKIRKLESVGVLAGGIAHDFNNLLAAIMGNISLAKYIVDQEDEVYSLLNEAEKASLRAKALTGQLLTFSKGGEPIRHAASIAEVIKDSADFVLRGSNVVCRFDLPEDLWLADIDKGQISQVIQNIIINAAQAMGMEGGRVEVKCGNIKGSEISGIRLTGNAYLVIYITDNGPGIKPTDLDRIFDPYFTTKKMGSGLGLAVTHSIINKHEGHISVTSTPGEGTTFTIYLPAIADQVASLVLLEKQADMISSQMVPSGKGRIMVMDDDDSVRTIAIRMLEFSGYEAAGARDGEEAIAMYRQAMGTESPYDLVIMDLTIPNGMGGERAVQKLLELDPGARVIVASGYSNDPVMAGFRKYGFVAAVHKPFQLRELSNTVREILS